MPPNNKIQFRKGTASTWTSGNPVLASGEPGVETDTLRLKIGDGSTAWSGLNYIGIAGTGSSNYLPKFTATQSVGNSLIYDNGTNVGIGLTSPAEKLDVLGNVKVAGANTSLTIAQDDTTTMRMRSVGNLIIAAGSAANVRFLISTTEHARLSDQGRFGIGLVAPSGKLGVSGGVTVGANYNVTPPTNGMIVEGNVGIGISSPAYKLDVSGVIRSTSYITSDTEFRLNNAAFSRVATMDGAGAFAGGYNVYLSGSTPKHSTSSPISSYYYYSDGTIRFYTNSSQSADTNASERLRITSAGDVGIGTASPGYKLQVAGSFGATTKSFRIDHPSKSGWNLEYGSLESPYHGVRLTGRDKVIKGVGVVSLPDYLKDLIHDDDTLNIQITNIKHGKTIYLEEIDLKNDQFIVKVDRAKSLGELQFCWTLTGVRKDVDHLVVEKEN